MSINKLKFLSHNKLSFRKKVIIAGLVVILIIVGIFIPGIIKQVSSQNKYLVASDYTLSSQIMVGGSVTAQTQEILHFQTGGKLAYLPVKEGDQVSQGQVIASLDSLDTQKGVTQAEASYRSAQAALNLVLDNIHLFQYGNGGFANVGSANETQTQKTQRQQAEEAVNVAYDNVQKAKEVLANTSLVAPFSGTIVAEDVKDVGVNIGPTTGFTLADLSHLIFQAVVSDNDIGYINVGDKAEISLDSLLGKKLSGVVTNIHPQKVKLPSGASGYQVDVESDELSSNAKFGSTGSVIFANQSVQQRVVLPNWVILSNQYVWVLSNNTPVLKKVEVGETYGDKTQILSGLDAQDKVILNPETIIKKNYQII